MSYITRVDPTYVDECPMDQANMYSNVQVTELLRKQRHYYLLLMDELREYYLDYLAKQTAVPPETCVPSYIG